MLWHYMAGRYVVRSTALKARLWGYVKSTWGAAEFGGNPALPHTLLPTYTH